LRVEFASLDNGQTILPDAQWVARKAKGHLYC
jgi:hypothetical protein